MQKPSILRVCVREEDAREREAPSDLKMPLEKGRADERVSRGQASERAVCVCVAVSVEKGARRLPLPAAVVRPPGGRRRRRLAITADLTVLGPVRNPVLLHRVRLFSLVPLVWESNPKLQGGWCKTQPPGR